RERGPTSGAVFGGGVDHFTHFGDLGGWEAADLGVLPDNRLVLGEIDAEGRVGRDKALDPLDVGAELAQDAVRLRRGALQLLALEAADCRNVPFDDELAQCHVTFLSLAIDRAARRDCWSPALPADRIQEIS